MWIALGVLICDRLDRLPTGQNFLGRLAGSIARDEGFAITIQKGVPKEITPRLPQPRSDTMTDQ